MGTPLYSPVMNIIKQFHFLLQVKGKSYQNTSLGGSDESPKETPKVVSEEETPLPETEGSADANDCRGKSKYCQ